MIDWPTCIVALGVLLSVSVLGAFWLWNRRSANDSLKATVDTLTAAVVAGRTETDAGAHHFIERMRKKPQVPPRDAEEKPEKPPSTGVQVTHE